MDQRSSTQNPKIIVDLGACPFQKPLINPEACPSILFYRSDYFISLSLLRGMRLFLGGLPGDLLSLTGEAFFRMRQASEQNLTSVQTFSHFLRHTKGRPQTTHGLEGRSAFFRILGIPTLRLQLA